MIASAALPRSLPGFNEAAGIHRRKRGYDGGAGLVRAARFNEAAGIHRRKLGTLNQPLRRPSLLQ